MNNERKRLDLLLVESGLAASRSRARDLIRRGQVTVARVAVTKPGARVAVDAVCALEDGANAYVSRGGLKLAAALDAFRFNAAGRVALDLGASTGGFTDVLLEKGARRVYAADVGHGQLHQNLRDDPRVVVMEKTDARDITPDHFTAPVTAITADLSFISLEKALPAALALAAPGAWMVLLVKPQFEAGPALVGRGGIVRDRAVHEQVIENVRQWLTRLPGWRVIDVIPSPVEGAKGNREYLLGAIFDG